jgi:hypothetical protein
MTSIADRRRALQRAQNDHKTIDTATTRRALADAQQALRQSPEAARARRAVGRVRLSS